MEISNILVNDDRKNLIKKALKVKDENSLSDRTYNSLRISLDLKSHLPSIDEIRAFRKVINKNLTIYQNKYGVFINIKQKILELMKQNKIEIDENFINKNSLDLKFSGDGKNVGKVFKIFNFTLMKR